MNVQPDSVHYNFHTSQANVSAGMLEGHLRAFYAQQMPFSGVLEIQQSTWIWDGQYPDTGNHRLEYSPWNGFESMYSRPSLKARIAVGVLSSLRCERMPLLLKWINLNTKAANLMSISFANQEQWVKMGLRPLATDWIDISEWQSGAELSSLRSESDFLVNEIYHKSHAYGGSLADDLFAIPTLNCWYHVRNMPRSPARINERENEMGPKGAILYSWYNESTIIDNTMSWKWRYRSWAAVGIFDPIDHFTDYHPDNYAPNPAYFVQGDRTVVCAKCFSKNRSSNFYCYSCQEELIERDLSVSCERCQAQLEEYELNRGSRLCAHCRYMLEDLDSSCGN